jgi:nitrogen fixation protein NifX
VLKIAFATTDGTAVDQHFGWCQRFDVYQLDATSIERTEIRELSPDPVPDPGGLPASAEFAQDSAAAEHFGKIDGRLEAVRDCAIVHVAAIGGGAAARVVNAGIMPVKVPEGTPVDDVLTRLQAVLEGTPPPWLRKAMMRHDPSTPAWSPR